MFRKNIPSFYIIIFALSGCALTFLTLKNVNGKPPTAVIPEATAAQPCNFNITRLTGCKMIQPLLLLEPGCEAPKYAGMKANVTDFIEYSRKSGDLFTSSVFVKDLASGDWTAINGDAPYHPGSLLKVNTLITWLRMAETTPGLLDQEIQYDGDNFSKTQTFNSHTIVPGHKYKIRELLHSMIAYSDNHATTVLTTHFNPDIFQKTFTDIGLAKPDLQNINYQLSAKDYSRFMNVLYDASYNTVYSSEYALSLLTECDFKDGVIKGIPDSVIAAHKFGETGGSDFHELHESAIVYLPGKTYLLTIMTRGPVVKKLPAILTAISKIVYDNMAAEAQIKVAKPAA